MKELFCNEIVRKYFVSDVLDIPVEKIRSVRLTNTFLRRQYRYQKLGILDVALELDDDTKINIELQVKRIKFWDRRQLFYVCKLFSQDMMRGEKYEQLKRCIGISILDFNLDGEEEYHNVYQLRNQKGHMFSDRLEIHTIELRKKLKGTESINDWIRLFNAESERDLDMIRTKNIGIIEAIRELKKYSLSKRMRMQYEYRLKYKRDLRAREDYVRDEGIEIGREDGIRKAIEMFVDMGVDEDEIKQRISEAYEISMEEVGRYMKEH